MHDAALAIVVAEMRRSGWRMRVLIWRVNVMEETGLDADVDVVEEETGPKLPRILIVSPKKNERQKTQRELETDQ